MEIEEPFSMTDECGRLGKAYSSTILAFAPGAISTVSYNIPLGQDFASGIGNGVVVATKTLDLQDMICPTWGLSGPYNPDITAFPNMAPGSGDIVQVAGSNQLSEVVGGAGVTIGAPFYPIIVMPTGILTVDPAWTRCSSNLNQFFPIFDPPQTLAIADILDVPAAPALPPTPTPEPQMIPPASTSSPFVAQAPPEQPPPTVVPNPEVQTGIVQEQADPTNANVMDAGLPGPAVSPSTTNPLPATPPASATFANDPNVNAAKVQSSPVAPIQQAQTTEHQEQAEPNLAGQLNAALAVTKSQAAAPIQASPPNSVNNAPSPNEPAIPQTPSIPSPTNNIEPQSPSPVVESVGAGAPPAVTSSPPNNDRFDSPAPAPAFAGVINDNNDSGSSAGPPPISASGLGGQIYRPFVPATTAQSTIEVAPVPAGGSGSSPSPGAQVAPNQSGNENPPQQQQPNQAAPVPAGGSGGSPSPGAQVAPNQSGNENPPQQQQPNQAAPIPAGGSESRPSPGAQGVPDQSDNDNSPQQQQPNLPANNNNPPASIPNPPQTPPAPPNPSPQPSGPLSTPQNNPPTPPNNSPESNSPQEQGPSPSQQQQQPPSPPPNPPAIHINSQTYTRNSASAYIIASQTLIPGGAVVTISNSQSDSNGDSNGDSESGSGSGSKSKSVNNAVSGTPNGSPAPTSAPAPVQISLATDGSIAVIGSSTQDIVVSASATPPAPPLFSSGASSYSPPPMPSASLSSDSSETEPESAFTINNQPFMLQPTPPTAALVTGADSTMAEDTAAVTLTAVGQTVTIASAPVALASSEGSVVLVEGTGTGASVVAVPSATQSGGGVVIEPAPSSESASASAQGVGSGAVRKRVKGLWAWAGWMGFTTLMMGA